MTSIRRISPMTQHITSQVMGSQFDTIYPQLISFLQDQDIPVPDETEEGSVFYTTVFQAMCIGGATVGEYMVKTIEESIEELAESKRKKREPSQN